MKKIIGGKLYNTETAAELGSCGHNSLNDFRWYQEILYRKKTGEFFLYGEGYAASPYSAAYSDGTRGPGEKIIPLTAEAARRWAEESLDADEYEKIFGEVAEDDSRTTLSLSVSVFAAKKARRAAAEKQCSLSAYIESLIIKEEEAK